MQLTVRNVVGSIFSHALSATGLLLMEKKRVLRKKNIISLYCHDPGKEYFERCVVWLRDNGFTFLSVEEVLEIGHGKKEFPKGGVLITVDDGWRNNKEAIAAIAKKYEIPITIFVSTDPVITGDAYWWSYIKLARSMGVKCPDVETIKKLSNEERLKIVYRIKPSCLIPREALTVKEINEILEEGFVSFESHTVTHPILTNCSVPQVNYEISESKKIIESWTGKKVIGFAYPNGNHSEREIECLKKEGYKIAFTTVDGCITPRNISNIYNLPRVDMLETVSFTENLCRITGVIFRFKGIMQLAKKITALLILYIFLNH